MVKRKAAKKAAKKVAKKTAKKKAAKKTAAFDGAKNRRAAKTTKPRRKSEEQMELMPGTRYADLDRYCRNIGDNRDEVQQLKGEGRSIETGALKAMRVHGVRNYKNAGVALSIEPGDEKLVVKRDRNGGTSDGGQVERKGSGDDGAPETGTGQEPGAIGEALTEGSGDED
jgi:hypothetical protein